MEKIQISKEEALETIQSLRKDISAIQNRKKGDFIAHFVVYIFVIAMLWYVNLSKNSDNLWAIYPTLGWGMGITFHFLEYKNIIHSEEKITTPQEDFRSHFTTFLVVIAFLWGVNLYQTPSHLWVVYPTIFWGMAVAIHFLKSRK